MRRQNHTTYDELGSPPSSPIQPPKATPSWRNGDFHTQVLSVSLACCATFCVGCMLVWAQAILKPLVFSIILVYLLSPLVRLLTTPVTLRLPASPQQRPSLRHDGAAIGEKTAEELIGLIESGSVYGRSGRSAGGVRVACPGWLAITVVLAVVFAMLSMLVNAFASGCSSLQERFPVYRSELLTLLERFTRWLEKVEPRAKDVLIASLEKWLRELPFPSIMEDTVSAIFGGLESIVLVSLFTVYLLQDPKGLSDLLVHTEIDRQLRRYVVVKTLICVAVGVAVGLIFSFVAAPLAFMVGLLTFVANYFPFFGLLGTILPMPLLILDPSITGGARALAFLLPLAAHLVVSNVVEPKVFGQSMELHPVVVLLSFAFWGALWGVMGCLLSIPLTVSIRIVWSHWRASAEARNNGSTAGDGGEAPCTVRVP